MTKTEFLARCATAYDAGLIRPETVRLLDRWTDMVMRFEGAQGPRGREHQLRYFTDLLEAEERRTEGWQRTLANDVDGYALIQLAAILTHPCNICATDPHAWWTRVAFCPHDRGSR